MKRGGSAYGSCPVGTNHTPSANRRLPKMNAYALSNIKKAKPLNASRLVVTGTKPKLEEMLANAVRKVEASNSV